MGSSDRWVEERAFLSKLLYPGGLSVALTPRPLPARQACAAVLSSNPASRRGGDGSLLLLGRPTAPSEGPAAPSAPPSPAQPAPPGVSPCLGLTDTVRKGAGGRQLYKFSHHKSPKE